MVGALETRDARSPGQVTGQVSRAVVYCTVRTGHTRLGAFRRITSWRSSAGVGQCLQSG